MSKCDKLLMRICSLSRNLRFDELRKVLVGQVVEREARNDEDAE